MKNFTLHLRAKGIAGSAWILCAALIALHGAVAVWAQTPAAKPAAPPAKPEQDIIENLNMVTPDGPWWYWWLIASSVLVMFIPLFFVFRRLYKKKMLPFQAQPVPPETSALEKLAAIRHYIDEGAVRDFVREASDILRSYIEARFGLRAPRLSTEEFLYEAEHSAHLEAPHRIKLAEFLFRCDRVKFGLGDLDKERMEALYFAAEDFIKSTGASVAATAASAGIAKAASARPKSSIVPSPIAPATPPPAPSEPPSTPASAKSVEPEAVTVATSPDSEPAKTEVAG